MRRDLTDEELAAVARGVVRAYLEVQRGHRDVRVLRAVLAPHVYMALKKVQRPPGAAPVLGDGVGGVQFSRLGAGKGYAVVVVRDTDGRWGAVMLVLRRGDAGGWQVMDLRRLRDAVHMQTPTRLVSDDTAARRSIGGWR